MPDGNLLLTLRQINICLGLYESEKLAASEMTFAQAFLLNEIFSMDSSCVCSTELCERMGFTRSSISRTLKELRKNGYVKMKMDKDDNRKKHIVLTPKAHAAEGMAYDIKQSGERIRQFRIQGGYTQEKLAGALNIDRSLLSHIEAGKRGCSVDLLIQLSSFFDVSLDLLVLGKDLVGIVGALEGV